MKLKLVYILSFVEKSLAFEWVIDRLDRSKYELHFVVIGNDETPLIHFLRDREIPCQVIQLRKWTDTFRAFQSLYKALKSIRPDIVHAHLFEAGRLGILAAWVLRVKRRIYTRHYGSYHHQYNPRGVYFDKIINLLSTEIVAVSNAVREVLINWEQVPEKKVTVIPHGFDFNYFLEPSYLQINDMRAKYKIPANGPVLGVISRYTQLKGVQFVIPAFALVRKSFPNVHLVLANAVGDFKNEIDALLKPLPRESYTEIIFEHDVRILYQLFDVFIHVPIDPYCEAFGQTYIEALASGRPSVFTISGIASEFIVHEKNALVIPYKNPGAIADASVRLLTDKTLAADVSNRGRADAERLFSIDVMINRLDRLYKS
jgi:glycosyltransferase involved in cell wall biosynthesis